MRPGLGLDAPPQKSGGESYRVLARKYRPSDFSGLIGQEALKQHTASLVGLVDAVRSGAGLVMLLAGLLLLAVAAITAAIALWRSGTYQKWSGVPLAAGIALYIPQFLGTQPVRVAHGLLVGIGCLWIAAGLWRQGQNR